MGYIGYLEMFIVFWLPIMLFIQMIFTDGKDVCGAVELMFGEMIFLIISVTLCAYILKKIKVLRDKNLQTTDRTSLTKTRDHKISTEFGKGYFQIWLFKCFITAGFSGYVFAVSYYEDKSCKFNTALFLLLSLYIFRALELAFLIRIGCWVNEVAEDFKNTVKRESLIASSNNED